MLRRGIKTQAETISAELRGELNLTLHDRLDWTELAGHFCIPVDPVTVLANWGATKSDLDGLIGANGCFSAMTQYRGTRCRIFYNPNHSKARTANSVAHELAHVILEHKPGPAIGPDGTRNYYGGQEAEATWQAGRCSFRARAPCAGWRPGGTMTSDAEHFGVSVELFVWRVNQTGVVRQLGYRTRRVA